MTTRVVTTFWVDTFSADLVALAVGLSALAEHLEEGRWLFAGDDIHVPLRLGDFNRSERPNSTLQQIPHCK